MDQAARGTRTLREINRTIILNLIKKQGTISRAQLAKETSLTRSTVSQVVGELLNDGLVVEIGTGTSSTGRKPILLRYNANAGYVIGIEIGSSKIRCGIADLAGNMISKSSFQAGPSGDGEAFLRHLSLSVSSFARDQGVDFHKLKAVGVAIPGIVDPVDGSVLRADSHLRGLEGLPLGSFLRKEYGVQVQFENDVNAALLGECWRGSGSGKRNLALMAVSNGIGAALMIDGKLYRGSRFAAGEIGYWLLGRESVGRDWRPHGCLETLASGSGIAARARELWESSPRPTFFDLCAKDPTRVTAKVVFEAARMGDELALTVVRETADYLAIVICNLSALLDLECVILGGGVSLSSDLLLTPIREIVARYSPVIPEILPSALGDQAGLYGAVALGLGQGLATPRWFSLESRTEVI